MVMARMELGDGQIGLSSLASFVVEREIKVSFPTCNFNCLSVVLNLYARELQIGLKPWQSCHSTTPFSRGFFPCLSRLLDPQALLMS